MYSIYLTCLKHASLVVVAMSGGVDSSVTAALLAQDVRVVTVQDFSLTGKK
jgi:tRNA U34 2-thiouridine synthase MnmA/TrmU